MKTATISQTKNSLSALLDLVRQGETILIMDRTCPIARIEPIVRGDASDTVGRIERLERGGWIRRGNESLPDELLDEPPPMPRAGADILAVLLSERDASR